MPAGRDLRDRLITKDGPPAYLSPSLVFLSLIQKGLTQETVRTHASGAAGDLVDIGAGERRLRILFTFFAVVYGYAVQARSLEMFMSVEARNLII